MKRFFSIFLMLGFVFFLCSGVALAIPVKDGAILDGEYDALYVEDTKDDDYVDPGYGGQAYDAEKMGITVSSSKLYFGLQTGLEITPEYAVDDSTSNKQPGDLAIDLGGDGIYEFGIRFWEGGFNVIAALGWTGPRYSQHDESGLWRISDGNSVGSAVGEFFDTIDYYGQSTNVLEGYVTAETLGLTDFMGFDKITVNWTMYCGNDFVRATAAPAPVPEPATMFLLGFGLLGLAGLKRKS